MMNIFKKVEPIKIADVVESYKGYLKAHPPMNYKTYCANEITCAPGTRVEAIVFSILQQHSFHIGLEDPVHGGPDFTCTFYADGTAPIEFDVEVTCLLKSTVETQMDINDEQALSGKGFWFQAPKVSIRSKVEEKSQQLKSRQKPIILFLTSESDQSSLAIGGIAVEEMFVWEDAPKQFIPASPAGAYFDSGVRTAVFYSRDSVSGIVATSTNISAVILAQIHVESTKLCGALHPNPAYPFPINIFPGIPFASLKQWPCTDENIEIK